MTPLGFDMDPSDPRARLRFYRELKGDEVAVSETGPLHRVRIDRAAAAARRFSVGPVLELGCGTGPIGRKLLDSGAEVVFLDLSAYALARLRELAPGARALAADAERLPFRDRCFGTLVASEVLEHLPESGPALAEWLRVLKPGGVLILTVPNLFSLDAIEGSTRAVSRGLGLLRMLGIEPFPGGYTTHLQKGPPRYWARRLERAGFEPVFDQGLYPIPYIPHFAAGLKAAEDRLLGPDTRLGRALDRFESRFSTRFPFNRVGQCHLFAARRP